MYRTAVAARGLSASGRSAGALPPSLATLVSLFTSNLAASSCRWILSIFGMAAGPSEGPLGCSQNGCSYTDASLPRTYSA
eukprot:14498655-Heterocapsa_arctica.AAC.1